MILLSLDDENHNQVIFFDCSDLASIIDLIGFMSFKYHFIESLILAQDERWRRA